MPTYLVDPAAQTVETIVIEGEFLDCLRQHIGAPQLNVLPTAEARLAVWFDQMGMLRPGRSFWRFADSDYRYAGRCVLTGLQDGRPVPLPAEVTLDAIRAQVIFHGADCLERIAEELVIIPDEAGRPVPAIARRVIWKDVVTIAPPEPLAEGWTIYERPGGDYRIVGYRLKETGEMEPVSMFTAANLDEARERLPDGLTRIEPEPDEADYVTEHWKP